MDEVTDFMVKIIREEIRKEANDAVERIIRMRSLLETTRVALKEPCPPYTSSRPPSYSESFKVQRRDKCQTGDG